MHGQEVAVAAAPLSVEKVLWSLSFPAQDRGPLF